MNRVQILERINKDVYEGRFTYEDIVDQLDDAIIKINDSLNANFPPMSEKLTTDSALYTYDVEGVQTPIFPFKYIRTIVIEYAIAELLRREDEFGSLYQTASANFSKALDVMFRDHFNRIPAEFLESEDIGFIKINSGSVRQFSNDFYQPHNYGPTPDEPLDLSPDPLDQGEE